MVQYLNKVSLIPELTPLSQTIINEYKVESYELFKNFTEMFDTKNFEQFYKSSVPS